ncbi:hypothetical protein, partial [Arabidopsis thaliana]
MASATTLLFHHGSTRVLVARRRCQASVLRPYGGLKPFLSFCSLPNSTAPFRDSLRAKSDGLARAYVTGAPPIVEEPDPKIEESKSEAESKDLISWGLLWSLMSKHKLRLRFKFGCFIMVSVIVLSKGRFFEVLIGVRPEPLWRLLSKIAVLYSLEPIFTIAFVTNMTAIWENVMAILRAQIFRRVLIQKAEFFDKYKVCSFYSWFAQVGELTGLLTSDLGALNSIVNDNISRDRGFRAFTEASHFFTMQM